MTDQHRSGFIALVGPANAGKSTLLNALLGKKVSIVSPKPQTTRNRVLGIKDGPDFQMIFLDTPGFFEPNRIKRNKALGDFLKKQVEAALEGIDITLLVVDTGRLMRDDDYCKEILERYLLDFKVKPDLILLNKIDAVEKEQILPMLQKLHDHFSSIKGGSGEIELLPISARTGDGLKQLEQILLKKLPLGVQYFPEGQSTDQSDETLASEIIREKLFQQLNDEIPYSIAVRIERWEDEDELSKISAVIAVERESQKPIVIGAKGSKLKNVGTAARKDLERVFGTKVYLELFVKVEEHWTMSEKGLRKVGLR